MDTKRQLLNESHKYTDLSPLQIFLLQTLQRKLSFLTRKKDQEEPAADNNTLKYQQ